MGDSRKKKLGEFFEEYLNREPLIQNKEPLQSVYTPQTIVHREEQIDQIAKILAPCLRNERPSNLFLYGKTGTGKTCVVQHVCHEITHVAQSRDITVQIHYLNCKLKKIADTEYRLIAQLTRELGKDIPSTGLPTDEVYKIFTKSLEDAQCVAVLILDEIDQLVKKTGDEILYNLTRLNTELRNSKVCIIGISNDLMFANHIDPRVKSSLSEEELVFPPYNALQLQDILRTRSDQAFKKGSISSGVIEKCAAYAAREHGDARRAIDLLRVAGEVAEREQADKLHIKHLDLAEDKIEKDRVIDIVSTQPMQQQTALYSILTISSQSRNSQVFTGEVYDLYKELCTKISLRPLTQRRISDIMTEFDMLGIINAKVISKGRYGRTREIRVCVPPQTQDQLKKIIEGSLHL